MPHVKPEVKPSKAHSIRLHKTTLSRLQKHGAMKDSYNSVINKILDKVEKK